MYRELDGVRLDGPRRVRLPRSLFVIARKHILTSTTRKRTALYEVTSDHVIIEDGEFPSAGDTSYAGCCPD